MIESTLLTRILLATSQTEIRLFRNNVGMGWIGRHTRLDDGAILIHDPRPLHAGLHGGSGDLIGWTPITITERMVGHRIAVFTSIEAKQPRGRVSPAQRHWCDTVTAQGGIAGVARSEDEALDIVHRFLDAGGSL